MKQKHESKQEYPPGGAVPSYSRVRRQPVRPRVLVPVSGAFSTSSSIASTTGTCCSTSKLRLLVVVMLGRLVEAQLVHVTVYGVAVVLLGAVAEARVQLVGFILPP